ncbi:hypothetical protein M2451_000536 [Dysgonomonas sp. PFB1-18]|uniref:hypothetical protein n=1 Tax=unclassified Dysgonomonas TaxID=2630389 RepID=UPI0024741A2A|nr:MULTISPECIES: hypothetical protein [unclassified Dysgonomonas]MDH6307387.1 hypothetical protein [Dysgonomonas sp. PF1-14]MDH6337305.1 hypothetical protein [Dysgonomonas sp. PF1-16]MDH6379229.1 hypothetical protein [Dysgonomonas sp. PFB1-18]MDH6396133.1 hypothetical protein [Dysgonomonas sp. PF1-23]
MKNNSLELELRKVEFSTPNDKIPFEKHTYNGVLGIQGCEAYYNHLDKLYNEYFENIRENIENLLFSDKNSILIYLNDKIILFDSIKSDFNEKNYMDWDAYIVSCEKYYSENIKSNQGAKNEYNTAKFFKEMSGTQVYFIEKGINDLQQLFNNYNGEKKIADTSKKNLSIKNNSLSAYVDDYFSRYSDSDTLTNKDLEFIFDITRPTIDKWKIQGKFIQISEEGKRPILYSKEDVMNKIKNGVLPHRLTDVEQKGRLYMVK